MITIEQIRIALQQYNHSPAGFEPTRQQAAVAMILADGDDDLEICFIRRAEHEGDPWSGQVALPGGRAGAEDRNAHDVAERETWEEIGLSLAADHRIGALPVREVVRPEAENSLTLSPFVYYIGADRDAVDTASHAHEVADVFWVPISHLCSAAAATKLDWPIAGITTTFPGIRFRDHVIWGLTLGVLNSFADIIRPHLTAATEVAQ
ncbi:MAG: NUDIX hydrolase [Porticoccaceae bacterium]